MDYFVTGATGFLGKFLVKNLLKRKGLIYVLVRKDSNHKLEDLRQWWGKEAKRVKPITGDLSKNRLGLSSANIKKLKGSLEGLYRFRLGKYRLFYSINEKEIIIFILDLKLRKDAYNK